MAQSYEETAGMVRELLDYDGDRRMGPWELNFIESLRDAGTFTERQSSKVAEIWQKVMG